MPAAPADYDLGDLSETLTDVDKKLWNGALAEFHGAKLSQQQLDAVTSAYKNASEETEKARIAAAEAAAAQTDAELRKAFGDDYDDTIERTNVFIREGLSDYLPNAADRKALFELRLEDGRRLGDLTPLVRWLSDLAEAR